MTESDNTEPARVRLGPIDAVITVAVICFTVAAIFLDFGEGEIDANSFASSVAVVAACSLWFRRQLPMPILLFVAAAHIFVTWNTGNEISLVPAMVLSLFTVARFGDRKVGLTVTATVGLVAAVAVAGLDSDHFGRELLGEAAIMAVPIAVGDATRSRADRLRDLIDTEASTRVQAERIRIARDLHDVVAHGLSIISIQSGVAAHLLDDDPSQAKEALGIINETGRGALEELRSMVGVLRSTDDAPLRPTPTDPNDISDLLEGAANAGVQVEAEVTGSFPQAVGDSCVVAVHRIIQEALTNVARHAGAAPTVLRIAHGDDSVEINIINVSGRPRTAAPQSTGVGLIGMRERAESLGGTLTAEPTVDGQGNRGFRVTSVLPYHNVREVLP